MYLSENLPKLISRTQISNRLTSISLKKLYCYILGIAISICFGQITGNLYRERAEQNYLATIGEQAREYATALGAWNSDGFAIGALTMQGRQTLQLKRVISAMGPHLQLRQEAEIPLANLATVVGADHAFVANHDGEIVAAYDRLNRQVVGLNVSFRPYFKVALTGKGSVYGAISSTTGERAFYLAAPVYGLKDEEKKVIGVVVARFDAEKLEERLYGSHTDKLRLILSPTGVVLSSNVAGFILKSDRSWELKEFIRKADGQFGNHRFANRVPDPLPFDTNQSAIYFNGQRYAQSKANFDWNDPGGKWSLIVLGAMDHAVSDTQLLLIKSLSSAFLFMLLWAATHRLQDSIRHKRDSRRIEQSERRLDLALQSGTLGLWDWNVLQGTVVNNDVWLSILGYTNAELERELGHGLERWTRLVHPADREQTMKHLKSHLEGHTGEYRCEYRMRNKSGEWLWILDIGRVMERNAQGKATRVTGVIQNITSSINVQHAIIESQTKLKSIISNIPGVVFRSLPTLEREMIFLSDAIEELSGYPAQYFYGEFTYLNIVHPDDLEIFGQSLGSPNYVLEYRIVTAFNEIRWVYDKGQLIQKDGDPQYLDGVIFDISERKLVETQVLESRKEAELATQAKSEFLDNMSHEIRTPLNAIIGMTHLVQSLSLDQEQREYIEKIDRAAKGLVGIINSVLDFSKIEAGKLDLEHVDFDLINLMEEILDLNCHRSHEKGLDLRLDIPKNLHRTYSGDPLRLTQVLTNLVSNSLKFTSTGHISIAVRQVRRKGDDVVLRFSVVDTGSGMNSEQQARLFNAFVQATPAISRNHGGTGLGLAISKRIVRMMQGDIWVHSTEGKGSEFKFTIQLKITQNVSEAEPLRAFDMQDAPKELRTGMSGVYAKQLCGARVLVVEDNLLNQEVLEGLLRQVNVQVVIASNGLAALDALQRESIQFDAVLMDCQMPVMDGYESARQIREHSQYQDIPIIAVTAGNLGDVQGRVLAAGMNDCITKPLEVTTLYRTLVRWVKSKDTLGANVPPEPEPCRHIETSPNDSLIDFQRGLASANQDLTLYHRLLRSFLSINANTADHLQADYEKENLRAIHSLAHELRGSSGNLGLVKLQDAAAKLEDGVEEGKEIEHLVKKLQGYLQETLEELSRELTSTIIEMQTQHIGSLAFQDRLDRLDQLLQEGNAEALGLIDSICIEHPLSSLLAIQDAAYHLEFSSARMLLICFRQSMTKLS